jgi:hypothetical protein
MTSTKPPSFAASESPTVGELLEDTLPVIDTVYVAGPPVLLLWAGMVLLALMLAGPFALLATVVVALAVAAALVGLAGAIVASPFLLVRHLRARRQRRAASAPARPLVSVQPQHVAA